MYLLNYDIWEKICSELPANSICAMRRVCKSFYNMLDENFVIRYGITITLDKDNFQNVNTMTTFRLNCINNLIPMTHYRQIDKITISNIWAAKKDTHDYQFPDSLEYCLKELNLLRYDISCKVPQTESLFVYECPRIKDISHLTKLTRLTLFDDELLSTATSNLKHLELNNCYVTDISRFTGLTSLDLFKCPNISDISSFKHLRRLSINSCKSITDISTHDALEHLDLRFVNIRELPPSFGLSSLQIVQCPKITMDLAIYTKLTNLALIHYMNLNINDVRFPPSIKYLFLDIESSLDLRNLTNLEGLKFSITDNVSHRLPDCLKTCTIFDYYNEVLPAMPIGTILNVTEEDSTWFTPSFRYKVEDAVDDTYDPLKCRVYNLYSLYNTDDK